MVSKRYQPLEDARAKAFEEARLQREARQSRSGGKYKELKAEHSRAAPDQKSSDRLEPRDAQVKGIEDQGSRRITPIEEKNNRMRQENYEKNKEGYERRQKETLAEQKLDASRLENMKKNYPGEYAKEMKDRQTREDWNQRYKDASERTAVDRNPKEENKWSRELSDKGRQTSDQARKGREGEERNGHDGHDRTGR